MKFFSLQSIIFSLFTLAAALFAQEGNLVNFQNFYPEELKVAGFTLNTEQEITIDLKVIAPRRHYHDYLLTSAWLLNSQTRDVAWKLTDLDPEERDRYTAVYQDELDLPAGTYEVYYSTYPSYLYDEDDYHWHSNGFFGGFFNALFDDDKKQEKYKFFDDLYDDLYCRISGSGQPLSADQIEERQKDLAANAFISFIAMPDDAHEQQIFKVTAPLEVEIYALGEARRDGDFDAGILINLNTRERVWQLTYRNSGNAGGSNKNRVAREVVKLEPGIYKAMYATDDSHAFKSWNTSPPYDPAFWGMMITPLTPAGRADLVKLDNADELGKVPVLELTKVRDDEYLSSGFTLLKPLNLHIYALGEGRDDEMFDYGWIIDAKTRDTIWEMTYRRTDNAGGAAKNRIFDGIVPFQPGNYIVYYVSDDSHAWRDWNTSPPFDPESWGITIDVMDENFREGDIKPYEPEKDPSILAQLVRIDDHAYRNAKFSLAADGFVHVYAIGEGKDGQMYDFPWIEDANTGKVVWEMTYRQTERAGGAKKNRQFDDKIFLPAGDYVVYYESDDSHAFNDWNDRPPRDPFNYGVTITKADQ